METGDKKSERFESLLAKCFYCFKANLIRLIAFGFSFIFASLTFYFFLPNMVRDKTDYDLYSSSQVNEVWFADSPMNSDCFVNLNGSTFLKSGKTSVSADIFMQLSDSTYENNLFGLKTVLNDGECSISKNIASEFNINVGDVLTASNGGGSFFVRNIFSAQSGLDDKYKHKGVVVLAPDERLSSAEPSYLFFAKNGSGFLNVNKTIFLKEVCVNLKASYLQSYICTSLLLIGAFCLNDVLVFRRKIYDYRIANRDGVKRTRLVAALILDGCFKYILPILCSFIIYLKYASAYPSGFVFLLTATMVLVGLVVVVSTLIYYLGSVKNGKLRQ